MLECVCVHERERKKNSHTQTEKEQCSQSQNNDNTSPVKRRISQVWNQLCHKLRGDEVNSQTHGSYIGW